MVVRFRKNQSALVYLGAAGLALLLGGCSSSDSAGGGAAAPSATVSGKLTQATVSDVGNPVSRFEANFATAGTSISLDCGTHGAFTGTVNSTTGDFSVPGVPTGVPCTFNFVNSTSGVVKCQVQFQDANNYDLNHNPMSTSTATASTDVALGSITCDSTGNITIPTTSVAGVDAGSTISSATAFNFTGTWTAAAYDGTLPSGYQTISTCAGNNCHGPAVGDLITLIRFHGYKFTPSAGQCTPATNVTCLSTDGATDTTKEGYGMSIWGGDYAHGPGACGNKTGFTLDEARAFAGLDLDATAPNIGGNQMSYGHYVFTTPTGFGGDAGWTQPWMYTGATASWPVQDCQPVSIPSTSGGANKAGYACFAATVTGGTPNNTYVWSVGLANAGGCVDSNGAPLMVDNWPNITFGTCSNTASAFNSHLTTSSCSYTGSPTAGAASTSFTCSWTGGSFTDVSGGTASTDNNAPNFSAAYTMPANTWNGQPATLLAQGAACKGTTSEATLTATATGNGTAAQKAAAAKELMYRYQCYANQYWQHSSNGAGSTTSCARNYDFDWSTNDYSKFVIGDDRSMKPQNAFITDRVFYSPDGQWGFLKNKERRYQTVPTASGSTLCPMDSMIELKFGRISDTKIIVNFSQRTVMADRSASCQAAVDAAIAGGGAIQNDTRGLNNLYQELQPQRMLFYMNK